MPDLSCIQKKNNGYALIVVLFSLAVIGILFAVSSENTLARLQDSAAEKLLIENFQRNRDVLGLALAWKSMPENQGASEFTVRIGGQDYRIQLQDVGGLVDLNTASPALLQILFSGISMSDEAVSRFREWRRDGRRLQRVGDMMQFVGATERQDFDLARIATVYSGRRGIALDVAPDSLKKLVIQAVGKNADQDPLFASQRSNVNFLVSISNGATNRKTTIGTIHLDASGNGQILEYF